MQKRLRDGMLILLACAAGCVDALSYLKLGHVFTANMTGNTVLLGIALGQQHGLAALRTGLALVGFSAGVAIGTVIVRRTKNKKNIWPLSVTLVLATECVLLWLFALGVRYADGTGYTATEVRVLILLSALTMGLQSAAGRRLDVSGVTTTYITGTLTGLIAQFVNHLFPGADASARPGEAVAKRARGRRRIGLLAGVWAGYLAAAALMAVMLVRFSFAAAVIPAALLTIIVATAAARYRQR